MRAKEAENEKLKRQIEALEAEFKGLQNGVILAEKQRERVAREAQNENRTVNRPQVDSQSQIDRVSAQIAQLETADARLKADLVTASRRNQEVSEQVQHLMVKRYKLVGEGGQNGHYELAGTLRK